MWDAMKRILLAGATLLALTATQPTLAADAPVYKGPAPYAAALFNWSGFYLGGTAGYAWGRYTQFSANGDAPSVDPKGFVWGGTLGYNWQTGNWVFGLETDISTGPKGTTAQGTFTTSWICGSGPCVVDIDYFGTVRGRLGVTMSQAALLYVTGGLAYGRFSGGILNSSQAGASTKTGWTAGAGLEWMFAPNWSAKLEYLHVDLGRADFGTGSPPPALYSARGSFDVVRVGLNFGFWGGR
jgi:outer membrane immunogenic protein